MKPGNDEGSAVRTQTPQEQTKTDAASVPQRRGRGKARATMALIEACHEILTEIQPASVRAVCYRLFTLGLIPNMSKGSTNKVSTQLVWAREQCVIPWEWVVDETREPERPNTWSDPDRIIRAAVNGYRRDRWQEQEYRVEVWSEKGTVRGTLAPVLNELGVTFRVMHGFASATAINDIAEMSNEIKKPVIAFYVGDWDPSGLHMSAEDLPSRLARYGGQVHLVRTALVEGDLADLPSFSADTKRADPRYRWFRHQHGATCWELDALNPVVLRDRIERAIVDLLDREAWERAAIAERAECESLETVLQAWPGISSRGSKYSRGSGRDGEGPRE